jgi:type IV pilus biogenesis protein CpaD/CtpE
LGISVHGSRSVDKRGRYLATLAIAVAAAAMLSACSPGADYPAVLVPPPARPDATMNPSEVQQATDDLVAARDRLTTSAQNNGQPAAPAAGTPAAAAPATTGSVAPQAKK